MINSQSNALRYWAVVPAAGAGTRMGSDRPKQYLQLCGKSILTHAIERMRTHPRIAGVVVVVAPADSIWPTIAVPDGPARFFVAQGGAERCDSVLSGLSMLVEYASPNDWVLVHDAARPCVRHTDIDKMIASLADDSVGGLLGVPVADTIKRTSANGIVQDTVDRGGLWRAQTPQMFRLVVLREALQQAIDKCHVVTDEASAMELAGYAPRMIEGSGDNIKITRPEDLVLAECFLKRQVEQTH